MKLSNLPDLSQFPRITRTQFCEQMDEVMDRVEHEDTAFVLTEQGKGDLLICPAHWFEFQIDNNFEMMVVCAVRYAVGRATYMPSIVDEFVRKYLSVLRTRTLGFIRRDIKEWLDREVLDQRELWSNLYADIGEEILKREIPDRPSLQEGEP